jgi:hypothetical protein
MALGPERDLASAEQQRILNTSAQTELVGHLKEWLFWHKNISVRSNVTSKIIIELALDLRLLYI